MKVEADHLVCPHKSRGVLEALDGEMFEVEGMHDALVGADLWGRVQQRLATAGQSSLHVRTRTPSGNVVGADVGVMVCA